MRVKFRWMRSCCIGGRVMWGQRWAVGYVQCDISWGMEKL